MDKESDYDNDRLDPFIECLRNKEKLMKIIHFTLPWGIRTSTLSKALNTLFI